jgi:hypothetical protein
MFGRLVKFLLSDYHRMVLATIGPGRFLGKLPSFVLRLVRRLQAKIFAPQPWSSTLFVNDDRPSVFSGRWLFGARASLDTPEFANDRQRVLARAEKARLGIFEVNGRRLELNDPPCLGRWDVDPVSGRRWPQNSAFAQLSEIPGDIRFPWELDRLYHLAWFGQAWRYTRNKHWPELGVAHLEHILREAPFEHGIHWRDGLQLAVRVYSLAAFADLCHDVPGNIHHYINNAIAAHAYALVRQISPHSEITNNHVIGEACALALAGIYLQREDYLRNSLRRLHLELKRQIYPDGVPYEGSVPYIRFDLDFLTLLALALKASRREIPFWLKGAITLIARALAGVADAKGRVPPIGDGDDARVLRLDEEPYLTVNESLHVASKITDESFAPAGPSDSFALWVVGSDLPATKPLSQTRHLSYSGLVHVNRGNLDVWLDCGPTGYGLSGPGGHGHNDTSSIVMHLNGIALLHDPGWYTYYGDRSVRDQLRSTSAHNTVRIDGQEQSRLGGMFEIRDDCKPTAVKVREFGSATAITCGHTGYSRLDKSIVYRRLIVVEGTGPWRIRLTDRIRSRVPINVECHLGSDLSWAALSQSEWSLPGGIFLRIRSGCRNVRVIDVPCSRKTGVLERGTALEWLIPARVISAGSEISYISRWEIEVAPTD